jgi:aryl-alcohol dehydrogenase-like predicted oxidoreductase
LSYAWIAHRPGIDSILVGPSSVAQLQDALLAVAQPLTDEVMREIDEIHCAFVGTDVSYAR